MCPRNGRGLSVISKTFLHRGSLARMTGISGRKGKGAAGAALLLFFRQDSQRDFDVVRNGTGSADIIVLPVNLKISFKDIVISHRRSDKWKIDILCRILYGELAGKSIMTAFVGSA